MRGTFFNHFCGGETVADLDPVIQELRKHGVGAILDYAAEVDAEEEEDFENSDVEAEVEEK